MTSLDALKSDLLSLVSGASDLPALEEARVAALGKKGRITGLMGDMRALSPEERKERGQQLNALKDEVAAAIEARRGVLAKEALARRLEAERVDVTLPARPEAQGRIHPITQTIDEIVAIFAAMGFTVAEGPEIEGEFNNFTALNMPANHPARQMHDTFYLPAAPDGTDRVLRTHTSPVQIRTMLAEKPPIRIIAPGRTYRSDYDQTHTPMFHQVEALVIGEDIHMGHLKGTLLEFARAFFGIDDLPVRFRPSFFPFTEPSAEIDIGCSRKGGELKLGNFGDWLEIGGSGMVHPKVLENCGLDPSRWQGFAFGMGIERMAMLKYGIPDLRTFFEADLRWLKHYGFVPLDMPNLAQGLGR
ncbi:phenylalanine--tRNA ligase subunit alpha [Aerophototrophica crusticola]|uniref:Phenylalanine--tRNA ligase alpha subunit n=1 Tax=Aerophototrophica crusticola TaxID=1709002 RepID=A0A858R902_9PROT|nr:phenylalanine--tRNA ligase subunit alpha [Rhodospirillaceae bacterium B3]